MEAVPTTAPVHPLRLICALALLLALGSMAAPTLLAPATEGEGLASGAIVPADPVAPRLDWRPSAHLRAFGGPRLARGTSLALHLLTGLLFAGLLHHLLADGWLALAVGALYLAHPAALEAVVLRERQAGLLAGLAAVAALAATLRARRLQARRWLVPAVVMWVVALLEQPSLGLLVAVLLAHGLWFGASGAVGGRRFALGLATGSALWLALTWTIGWLGAPGAVHDGSAAAVRLSAFARLPAALAQLVWPLPDRFGAQVPVPPLWAGLVGLLAAAVVLVGLGRLARRTERPGWAAWAAFGGLWWVLAVAAAGNLLAADEQLLGGAQLVLAAGGGWLLVLAALHGGPAAGLARRRGAVGLALLAAAGLGMLGSRRATRWSEVGLWTAVLDRDGPSHLAYRRLAAHQQALAGSEFAAHAVGRHLSAALVSCTLALETAPVGRRADPVGLYLMRARLRAELADAGERDDHSRGKADEGRARVDALLDGAGADCRAGLAALGAGDEPGPARDRRAAFEACLGTVLARQAQRGEGPPDAARLAEAEALLRRAVGRRPDVDWQASLAAILLARGQVDEAEQLLRGVIERSPDAPRAYMALGALLQGRRKDPAQALSFYTLGLARARDDTDRIGLNIRLAEAYRELKQPGPELRHWEAVLLLDRGNLVANLALSDHYVTRKKWRDALRHLNQAVLANPKARVPRQQMTKIYGRAGDAKLIALYKQLIARRPEAERTKPVTEYELLRAAHEDPEVLAWLASIAKDYERALAATKDDPGALQRMGMVLYLQSISELMVGNFKASIRLLARIVEEFPQYQPARTQIVLMIQLLVQLDKWRPVYQVIKKEVARRPDNRLLRQLKVQLDVIAEHEKRFPAMVQDAALALQADPKDAQSHWIVAKHYHELGQKHDGDDAKWVQREDAYANAEEHFKLAIDNIGRIETKHRLSLIREFVGALVRWIRADRHDFRGARGPKRATEARARFRRRLKQALVLLEPLYTERPDMRQDVGLVNNLAILYQMAGRFSDAIRILEGLERRPPHTTALLAELYYKRCMLAAQRGIETHAQQLADLRKRLEDVSRAIALLGAKAPARYRRRQGLLTSWVVREQGIVAYEAGQLAEAQVSLERAFRANTQDAAANHYLGLAYAGLKKDRQAATHLELAFRYRPLDPDYLDALARHCDRMGGSWQGKALMHYEALGDLAQRIARDPMTFTPTPAQQARWTAAFAHARTRIEALRKALHEAFAAAQTAYKAADWASAAQGFRRCLELRAQSIEARYYLAACLIAQGKRDDARSELERVVRRDPKFTLAHLRLGKLYLDGGESARAAQHLRTALSQGLNPPLDALARKYLAATGEPEPPKTPQKPEKRDDQ